MRESEALTQSELADDAPAPGNAPARSGVTATLRHPAIRRVLLSDVVSRLGSRMTTLALPWFVLVTTGSTARMGLVFAVEVVPVALLGIPSGQLVARLGVRRTVVLGDVISAVLIALVPLLHLAGFLPFWLLLVIVAATGTVSAPYLASQRLLLPDVLGDDQAAITAGNALIESSTWGAQLIGPAIAGVLIAVMGALNVIWIDAGTFVVSAVLLFGLPKSKADVAAAAKSNGVLAGARYALTDGVLGRVMIAAVGYGLLIPVILISLPVMAFERYGANPHIAGWLLAAWGGGAVIGTVAVVRLVGRIPPLRLGAIAGLAMAVPLWFLPLDQPATSVAAIMLFAGFFIPMLNAPAITVLTTRPPPALRPQVVTFFVTAATVASPVAYAAAGALFGRFGSGPVLLAVAAGVTGCGLVLLTLASYQPGESPGAAAQPAGPLPEEGHAT
jgi:MFS family permease